MGQIADILNSPEWEQKTPLEKAQARRDLFALSLQENPQLKTAFDQAAPEARQKLVDGWKQKLQAQFPDAFTTKGFSYTIEADGSKRIAGEGFDRVKQNGDVEHVDDPVKTPVYDVKTEQLLAAAADPKNREKIANLPADAKAMMAPFMYERYGQKTPTDIFGKPDDFIKRDDSTSKKALGYALPFALRAAPPMIAGALTEGNPKAIAAFAAAGSAAAQQVEQLVGARQKFSPVELGLDTLSSLVPAATIGKYANPIADTAAKVGIHALSGAAQGAGYELTRGLLEDGNIDFKRVNQNILYGASLGGLIFGVAPAIAARFAGKNRAQALDMIAKELESSAPGVKEQLTELQRRIHASLGIDAAPSDPNVIADRASAMRSNMDLGAEPLPREEATQGTYSDLKGQLATEVKAADAVANENDLAAFEAEHQADIKKRAGQAAADEAAARLENRTGSAISPESSIPAVESAPSDNPAIVDPTSRDPLGNRYRTPAEIDVGQSGTVRPAWDATTIETPGAARNVRSPQRDRAIRQAAAGELPSQQPALEHVLPAADPVAAERGRAIAAISEGTRAPEVPAGEPLPVSANPEPPELPRETPAVDPRMAPIEEVPIKDVVVNKDVKQFKGDSDSETGVVEKLGGKYERLGTAPVVIWQKLNGEREIVTGRHRLDLARRSGEATIPAQVVKESNGFTRDDAIMFDAESNIRDGQGAVKDYAKYFRTNAISRAEAEQGGLLSRSKGNSGWILGKDATEGLWTLYANGQIPEGKAVAIARGAPGNEAAQNSGIRASAGKTAAELELYTRNLSTIDANARSASASQLGFDGMGGDFAEFERQAAALAQVQAAKIKANQDLILAAEGASKRPEAARKMGLPIDNPDELKARIQSLRNANEELRNPTPEIFDQLRQEAGLPPTPKGELFNTGENFNLSGEVQKEEPAAPLPDNSMDMFGEATRSFPPTPIDVANELNRRNPNAGFINRQLQTALAGGAVGFATGYSQGDSIEDRLRNGLMVGLVGLGGGYALGRRFLGSSIANPVSTGAINRATGTPLKTLSDLERILTPPSGPSLLQRAKDLPSTLATHFISSFTPLKRLESNVYESAGLPKPALDMASRFEQVAGAAGKAKIDVEDFEHSVIPTIAGNEKDFDMLLVAKRTGQRLKEVQDLAAKQAAIENIPPDKRTPADLAILAERADRKRVADWTLADVDNVLGQLEQKLGKRRFNELDQIAAGPFQIHLDQALRLQVASGRLSQESFDAIKAGNDFYAPFRVLKAIESAEFQTAAGIDTRDQIAKAIKGIDTQDFRLDSPLKAAQEQIFAARVLAEKNLKMQELASLADKDPNGVFVRRLQGWEEPRKGFETVNYFDNGQPTRLEVSPDAAQAVKGLNQAQTSLAALFLRKAAMPFRAGATTANAAFQAVNLGFADQPRLALISKYGLNSSDVLNPMGPIRMPADFLHALYSSISANMAGKQDQLYRDFFMSGAGGSTVQEAITPDLVSKPSFARDTAAPAMWVLEKVADFSKAVEETTKLMGFKRGVRLENIEQLAKTNPAAASEKLAQVVTEVRNFAGSPDFARRGKSSPSLNLLFMFFNARIQGASKDLGRLAGMDGAKTAAAAYGRLGVAVGVPAVGLWYLNQKDGNKDDYEKIPQTERENYFMIPQDNPNGTPKYFTNSEGQQVREYFRIPKRESVKLFANMVESGLKFAETRDANAVKQYGISFLENIAPVNVDGRTFTERLESIAASTNPLIRAGYETASGRNAYTHRDTIPDRLKAVSPENQYRDSTPELFVKAARAFPDFAPDALRSPLVLQQLTQTLSAGLVTQFTPGKQNPDRSPMAGNIVGHRFFRSEQLNNQPEIDRAKAALTEQADAKFAIDHEAQAALDSLLAQPANTRGAKFGQIATTRQELAQRMADIADKKAKGITYDETLISQLNVKNGARAKYLLKEIQSLPQAKRGPYIETLAEKGLLTDDVAEQMAELVGGAGRN